MSVLRFFAIILIFGCVSVAWMILAGTVFVRTDQQDEQLAQEVRSLWGPKTLAQAHPYWGTGPETDWSSDSVIVPEASNINVKLTHENRRKGLLWYSMFTADFRGEYTIPAAEDGGDRGFFHFDLPNGATPIDLEVHVDGNAIDLPYKQRVSGKIAVPLARSQARTVTVAFRARGQLHWLYFPAGVEYHRGSGRVWDRDETDSDLVLNQSDAGVGELRNFSLTVTTDFKAIDYPTGAQSPNSEASPTNGGLAATWEYDSLITGQPIGVTMPAKPNAGPIIGKMTLLAPVSLLFFLTVLFTVVVLKKIPLHPMHYLFVSAGFFAFHILLAYLTDHIDLYAAFWICAAVSGLLVVSYMRLVAGITFAAVYVGVAQLVYLVGFSYAFFWKGMTGLAITIGAVLTLLVLMQATGRVNWFEVFGSRKPGEQDGHTPPVPGSGQSDPVLTEESPSSAPEQ